MFGAAGIERAIFGRGPLNADERDSSPKNSTASASLAGSPQTRRRRWWPLVAPVVAVVATFAFGSWSLNATTEEASDVSSATVAIIQGSLDTEFDGDTSKLDQAFKQYAHMTREVTKQQEIDLVLWPESMFRFDTIRYDDELRNQKPSPDFYSVSEWAEISSASTKKMIREFGTKCLLGTGTTHYHVDSAERYNTAGFFSATGEQLGAYHKMHPVMFGEYIPFGDVFPWIYSSGITPLRTGLVPGTEPKTFEAAGVSFAPCICFENTVPHLIRRQVLQLSESGQEVDALVTLTNDGWFWGSKLLDLHLACGIFRAVENDRPMLIAANTGYSAQIDKSGKVLQKGPKRASKVLVADVQKADAQSPNRLTFYTRFGDVFAISNIGIALIGLILGRRRTAS
jgi:apolipoprotein N-acyltransferase